MPIGRTIMSHQIFGNVSFARTWAEYKSGFGHFYGDYWLGLDHVSYITNSRPQDLIFVVVTRKPGDQDIRSHYYYNFKVSDESNQYRFTFSSEAGVNGLSDCLTSLKNAPFSTIDVNNVDTCASDFNAGWWFTSGNCSPCNPNGLLRRDLLYWSYNVTHTHWASIPDNYGIIHMVMMLEP
ncbi:ficolin-2-like [Gigantopelta aegis]|uniref:ficolin-2-like n=1 Tax=Gigantopelta aegis TaxID=1735272 RepID=UPI001B88CFC9|nr:ficolin-2-like [Gigantopelta aegis]